MASREKVLELDLEIGGATSEEDASKVPESSRRQGKENLNRVWSGILSFNESISNMEKSGEVINENVELLIDKNLEGEEIRDRMVLVEKKHEGEKHNKKKTRKPQKPPRPPKGPLLDAADRKFVREITELAMRKRARNEQMKALKKMKAAKASSWNSTLSAMVITFLFFLVVIFQGISFRKSANVSLDGSPEPAMATSESWISVQYDKDTFASESNLSGSRSRNFAEEEVSGSAPRESG